MTCSEIADFLDDYVSGALPTEGEAAFESHLRRCPACAAYLNGYRQATAAAKAVLRDGEGLPAELPEELVAAILAARR